MGQLTAVEVSIEDLAGEAVPADPDTLQDPVTARLVQDQGLVHHAWGDSAQGALSLCVFDGLDTARHADTPILGWKELVEELGSGCSLPTDSCRNNPHLLGRL